MIRLEKYDDKTQTIVEPKEIEIKIEQGYQQHIIVFDKILQDSFRLDIKNSVYNPHLKEVDLSFENVTISSELLNILNDKSHMIVNIKINFLVNSYDIENKKDKIMELKQAIMYIDNIELTGMTMDVYLSGHVVV